MGHAIDLEHPHLSRQEILRALQKHTAEVGRPPSIHDPEVKNLVYQATREFGTWSYALKIAGLQTRQERRRERSLASEIHRLLNQNPMSFGELRRELSKRKSNSTSLAGEIGAVISQSRDIKSVGPNRKRVYFLEGQENLAQTHLDQVASRLEEPLVELLRQLVRPLTRSEIRAIIVKDGSEINIEDKVGRYIRDLIASDLIYKLKFSFGARGSQKYNSTDLFGNLAGKMYFCRQDCPSEIADFIIANAPITRLSDSGFRRSYMNHMKRLLI